MSVGKSERVTQNRVMALFRGDRNSEEIFRGAVTEILYYETNSKREAG